jgi:lysozyme
MTILGVDISKWDGNWNAEKAKQAGVTFVFIKASQATFTDPQFKVNWQKAKDAGLLRGAYHYLDYTKPAIDQANYFADLLRDDPGEMPPTIDYEQRITDNNTTTALGFLRNCLDQLIKRTELFDDVKIKKPMLYTRYGFWIEYGEQTNQGYWLQFPLWVAHYSTSSSPLLPSPWKLWNFWQFTAKGPGEAFGSESLSMDMDRFNGTLNELLEFIGISQNHDLNDLYANLEKRLLAVENSIASLSQGTPPFVKGVIERVIKIEQQASDTSQSLSAVKAGLNKRVSTLEQRFSNIGGVTAAPLITPAPSSTPAPSDSTTSSSTTTPTKDDVLYATCTINALNVRSGPGISYPMVAGLSIGQRVKVLIQQDGWAQIESPAGWSSEAYLSFQQDVPSDTPQQDVPTDTPQQNVPTDTPQQDAPSDTPSSGTTSQVTTPEIYGVCNTSGLNVRGGPGVTYPIIGGLTYGQRVKILAQKDGWAQVQSPLGWCNQSYLSMT